MGWFQMMCIRGDTNFMVRVNSVEAARWQNKYAKWKESHKYTDRGKICFPWAFERNSTFYMFQFYCCATVIWCYSHWCYGYYHPVTKQRKNILLIFFPFGNCDQRDSRMTKWSHLHTVIEPEITTYWQKVWWDQHFSSLSWNSWREGGSKHFPKTKAPFT